MDTTLLLNKVRKLEIKTKGLTKHIFSGEYHSAFKGRGMSFSEVREYNYGDDVRNIDWNVTARTTTAHVKVFEEERELTVMLLIDVSASSFFGAIEKFKNELMTEIAALISFAAINNNDKVGAIIFSDKIEKYLPPKKGKQNILRLIRELITIKPENKKTSLSEALIFLNNIEKKRSITFVLSDFYVNDYEQALQITSKKHDIIGVEISDEREKIMPNVGLMKTMDAETGKTILLDTGDAVFRDRYKLHFEDKERNFKNIFSHSKCDTLQIKTNHDYIKALQLFFKKRRSK